MLFQIGGEIMRKAQSFVGNGNMGSHNLPVPSHPHVMEEAKTELCGNPRANLYVECIGCPDFPRHCNGPKLAAFLDIMLVRDFHRRIRDHYGITNRQIAEKANPVSEATVAEYFSKKEKDFYWSTVAHIDYAIIVILAGTGFEQILSKPCPASSSEIRQMMSELEHTISKLEAECDRLKNRVATNDANSQRELEAQRSIYERMIDHLKRQMEALQAQLEKEEARSKNYLKRIDSKNLVIVASIMAVLLETGMLVAYIVWDFMHVGAGIFW